MSTKNVGWRDAVIRAFAAAMLLITAAAIPQHPLVALAVGFIVVLLIGTALFRVCPLYTLLRCSTCSPSETRTT